MLCRLRNAIERLFCTLKDFRRAPPNTTSSRPTSSLPTSSPPSRSPLPSPIGDESGACPPRRGMAGRSSSQHTQGFHSPLRLRRARRRDSPEMRTRKTRCRGKGADAANALSVQTQSSSGLIRNRKNGQMTCFGMMSFCPSAGGSSEPRVKQLLSRGEVLFLVWAYSMERAERFSPGWAASAGPAASCCTPSGLSCAAPAGSLAKVERGATKMPAATARGIHLSRAICMTSPPSFAPHCGARAEISSTRDVHLLVTNAMSAWLLEGFCYRKHRI